MHSSTEPVTAQDLFDQALELEIQAAGLRIQAYMTQADEGCYFASRGLADGQRFHMEALIRQRSASQLERMTSVVEDAL